MKCKCTYGNCHICRQNAIWDKWIKNSKPNGDILFMSERNQTMTKEALVAEFQGLPVRIKFFKQSRYQKARYKPEFVFPEAWIYTNASRLGYVITGEEYANEQWRKDYFDTIKSEAKK